MSFSMSPFPLRFGSRQGGGPGLFDPSGDAQVLLWHDARAGITLTDDVVSGWAPRVGAVSLATSDPSNRPAVGSLNGYDALVFASGDAMRAFGVTGIAQPFTIVSMSETTDLTGTQYLIGGSVNTSKNGGNNMQIYPGTGAGIASETATTGIKITVSTFNNTSSSLVINGSALTLSGNQAGTAAPGTYIIGARTATGNDSLLGSVGEVIILDGAISDGDRQIYEGYLAHRWAATAVLPGGHPYKDNPPTAADFGAMLMYEAGSPLLHEDSGYLRAA